MRWSMPRIHAGRSQCSRAKSPAAMIIAAAPSVIGGQSTAAQRVDDRLLGEVLVDRAVPRELGVGVAEGVAPAAGGDLGHLLLGERARPRARPGPAWRRG